VITQKELIESIRATKFKLGVDGVPTQGNDELLSDLNEALAVVSKDVYSDDTHFFYELIQNAQDNSYEKGIVPNLKFILLDYDPTNSEGTSGCLCVVNNEVGFLEENIRSICSVGKSTKKKKKIEGFIGEKGIGFKSVFKVSSYPHIFSNGHNFKLLGDDKLTGLSYIIPYWVEDIPSVVKENIEATCILLPLEKGKYSDIKDALQGHKAEATIFLDKLKRVEINIPSENYEAIFEEILEGDSLTLSSTINNEEAELQNFLLTSKKVYVPEGLNEEKRLGFKDRTISVALPLNKYKSFSVFGYLPTEMESGLPFIINADFLLTANREAINNTKWNEWLFDEMASFVTDEIVRLANTDDVKAAAYKYIPLKDKTSERFSSLSASILSQLTNELFILCEDGQYRKPSDVKFVSKDIRSLFSAAKHELYWIAEEVEPYYARVHQIGSERLTVVEANYYFYQKEFLIKQKPGWFLEYYEYLAKSNNANADDYPIIPLATGGMTSVNSHEVFIPNSNNELGHINGYYFPKILTIRSDVYAFLTQKRKDWISRLELQDVSISGYFYNVVIPKIESQHNIDDIEEKQKVISFVLAYWDELDPAGLISSDLPVLLNDERLVLSSEVDALVVPDNYQERGWDKIFKDESERSSLSILSQFYLNFEHASLSEYFNAVSASVYPQPIRSTQIDKSEIGGRYTSYDQMLNAEFFNNWSISKSGQKKAEISLVPSSFWEVNRLNSHDYSTLVDYLNFIFPDVDDMKTKFTWFYRRSKVDFFRSPYDIYLQSVAWVSTTKGLQKPSECFYNDKNLRRIFGDDLPYVTIDLSDEFLSYLGVKRDAETSTIIDYLKELSGSTSIDVGILTAIYSALKERDDLNKQLFSDHPIIYIPSTDNAPAHWCTSAQVIWDDISALTNDTTFKSLEQHYPEELKYFFISKLAIKETMDARSYADLWLNLQNKPKLNDQDWLLYCKAFKNVQKLIRKSDEPDWFFDFKSKVKLYSDQNRWVSIHDEIEPFLPDDPRLQSDFANQIPFIKRVGDSYESMVPLVQYLGFDCLSEVAEEQLVTKDISQLLSRNRYLTDYSIKLLVRLIARKVTEETECLERLMNNGKLAALLNLRETEVDLIEVRTYIPNTEIQTTSIAHSVFLDFDLNVIFIKRDTDQDDIRDDIERLIISRVLSDILNRKERDALEDSISRILQVGKEDRFKKLWDKKPNWHIPRPVLTFIDRVIKERKPHKLEKELQEQVRQSDILLTQQEGYQETPIDRHQTSTSSALETENRSFSPTNNHFKQAVYDEGAEADYLASNSERRENEGQTSHYSSSTGGSARTNSGTDTRTHNGQESAHPKLRSKSSRSNNTASNINQARRSRLMSYVVSDLESTNEGNDEASSQEQKEYRQKLGEKAELIVLEDLKSKGYLAERMPANNPGYDIEAIHPQTAEMIFVEVKGDSYSWSDKGVGISSRQYEFASAKGKSFYLAVVDNLVSTPNKPLYICDPVSYITEYRFDSGWAGLSGKIYPVESNQSKLSVLDQMLAFTDDDHCKYLLKYCDEMNYPLPEIGCELQNEAGEVVLEDIELLWENEKIIVFQTQDEVALNEVDRDTWNIYITIERNKIAEKLDSIFNNKF